MRGLGLENRAARVGLLAACVVVLALIGVYFQGGKLGVEYLRTEQLRRHLEVVEGHAGSPTQYRVLSEWLVGGWVDLLEAAGVPDPLVVGFLSFRVVQNILILGLAALYCWRLGLRFLSLLAALAVMTWSMTHSLFDSDLSFNLYSDLIFYLGAALLILSGKDAWLVPLMGVAALNRETSGLIVLMFLLARYRPGKRWDARTLLIAGASVLVFIAVYLGVRWALGPRPITLPHGQVPGLDLLSFNVLQRQTWVHLAASWSVFPLIAVLGFGLMPSLLRRWLVWITPIWLIVHFFLAVAAEVRLMLMPQILIFVPGAFLALQAASPSAGTPPGMSAPDRREPGLDAGRAA